MEYDIPKCPRCKDGGNVRLVSQREDKDVFDPTPGRAPGAQLFQCTCGWTLMRTKPKPRDKPEEE